MAANNIPKRENCGQKPPASSGFGKYFAGKRKTPRRKVLQFSAEIQVSPRERLVPIASWTSGQPAARASGR